MPFDLGDKLRASGARPGLILPPAEALGRIERDRTMLAEEVDQHPAGELPAPYDVAGGPLGDSCESLRDLVAHVLMWDEINLSVLTEARVGRPHWSLDSQWERSEAGRMLNAAGVAAGRCLPVSLLLTRQLAVRDALLAELRSYSAELWVVPLSDAPGEDVSIGAIAQYVMTVPRHAPYWHTAIHLDRLSGIDTDEGPRAG
jgi:hypothetical protein